ncbi:MAG: cation:proton antiporter [Candidatus Nanoarchaeia archaeon]|nr:cation:proton antiporter [Candidatus Nanoarchaeia archaeon]
MVQEVITAFAVIAGIILIGFLAELLFKKTRIPDVIFLILIGICIGPIFHLVDKTDFGFGSNLFTTFTLLFLLFQGALNIDFKNLFRSLKGAMMLTLTSFFFTILVTSLICVLLLRYPWDLSVLIGIILGGTSSAVVIPFVNNLPIDKKYGYILTLESAITDVLCIVGAITMFAIILGGDFSASGIIRSILSSFFLAIVVGVIGAMIWIFLLSKSMILMETHLVTIAFVLLIYTVVESSFVGASGAIAALSFGLILGNSKPILRFYSWISRKDSPLHNGFLEQNVLSDKAKSFYSEISFFVKVFFFVYLGILFDFSKPIIFIFGALITIGIFLIRIPAVKISFFKEPIDNNTKSILKVMVPKGLAAAVLAELAIQNKIPGASDILSLVFSVILLSIIATSFLVFITQRKSQRSIPLKSASLNKPDIKNPIFLDKKPKQKNPPTKP